MANQNLLLASLKGPRDYNIANTQAYKHAQDATVYEHRLESLSVTGLASGTKTTIKLCDAVEQGTLYSTAEGHGGYPVPVAVVFKFTQGITVPAHVAATVAAVASISERMAKHTLLLKSGRVQDQFLRNNSQSIGRLIALFDTIPACTEVIRSARTVIPENSVSLPRAHRASGSVGGYAAASDTGALMLERSLFHDVDERGVWNSAGAGAEFTLPEDFTQFQDCFVFPLATDGAHGVVDAGMLACDLFESAQPWQFDITPNNNAGLFPGAIAGGGVVTTFTTYGIDVSIIYRVCPRDRESIDVSSTWLLDDNLAAVTAANVSTIPADSVQGLLWLGWGPRAWDDNTDGGSHFFLAVDANGGAADYIPRLSIIRPDFSPALNWHTAGNYLIVGDGTKASAPADPNDRLQHGDWIVSYYNGRYEREAVLDPTNPYRSGVELPRFAETGVRTLATMRFIDGAVDRSFGAAQLRYGATYAAGANQTFGVAAMNSDKALVGLGGIPHIPVAWNDRVSDGFPGVSGRTMGDGRPITLQTAGGFVYPTVSPTSTTVQGLSVVCARGPYHELKNGSKGCGGQESAEANPIPNKDTLNAPIGRALTLSFMVPQTMALKPTVL